MTNHHTAQILAFLIYDVANLQRELQICRDALSKCNFWNIFSAYDLLKGNSSSVVHRINLRDFLSNQKEHFPLIKEFSALWLNICDSDGVFSFATFQSWFPNGSAHSQQSGQGQNQLESALAKLFTKHAQCYQKMKAIVRERLNGYDCNTFQLVDCNGDGFISRGDIELYLSAHNINVKHTPFDITGKLLAFFRVTPFSGGITFKMWTRLFHSTHNNLRFFSSPARTTRGSMTPRRRNNFMTPVRTPASKYLNRGPFTPVSTRRTPTWPMAPMKPSRSSQKNLNQRNLRDKVQSNSRHRRNNSGASSANDSGSTNPSGRCSERSCDFEDYGLFDSHKLSASRSRNNFKSRSNSNKVRKRSGSVRRRRSKLPSFSDDPLKKFSFSRSHTTSSLIQKNNKSQRKKPFPKTTYSMLFSKNLEIEDEKTQDDDEDVNFDSSSTKQTPVIQQKLLRLSDLESSPLEGDNIFDSPISENFDDHMSCDEDFL